MDLYSVVPDSCTLITVNPIGGRTSGSTQARLAETANGGIYIMNLSGSLLVSHDSGSTFKNVYPGQNITAVSQVSESSGSAYYTVVGGSSGSALSSGSWQAPPETLSGWKPTGATFTTRVDIADMIWSSVSTAGVIIGNGSFAGSDKIWRFDPGAHPFSVVVSSSAGLGILAGYRITDLDVAW